MGACSSQEVRTKGVTDLPDPHEFEINKSRLSHLIIIGDVTPNSARVWIKVPTVGLWQLVLSKYRMQLDEYNKSQAATDGKQVHVIELLDKESLTYCFRCDGLEANTQYYYRVSSGSAVLDSKKTCYFKTAKKNYKSVSVGFYSCHDPFSNGKGSGDKDEVPYEPGAWHSMAKLVDDLDLIIAGGDQVYLDSNEPGMTDLWNFIRDNQHMFYNRYVSPDKKSFRQHGFRLYIVQLIRQYYLIYWNNQDFSDIFGRVPSYMMWDDHEILDGWGSLTPKEKIEVLKMTHSHNKKGSNTITPIQDDDILALMVELTFQAAAQVYNEFQHCRNPARRPYLPVKDNPTGFEWDYSFQRGPEYQFYNLDMRGNHDCTAPTDRLLGRTQHERLLEWFDTKITKDTKVIFITSPVPFVHWSSIVELSVYVVKTLKDDLMDAWSHPTNHVERDKIMSTFFYVSHVYKIPIVILSGDVHCMSAYTLTDPKRFPCGKIISITSSGITRKPCPAMATTAFQGNGHIKTKPKDGKGHSKPTTIVCKQEFAKSGVHNYAVVKAAGKNVSCTFYWVGKTRGEMKQSTVNF